MHEIKNDAINLAFKEIIVGVSNKSLKYTGNQLIIKDVIERFVNGILNYDKKYAPFTIISLEKDNTYSGIVKFNLTDKQGAVTIGGTIDRIDAKNGIARIVDYKTGSASNSFSSISQLFNRDISDRRKAVFQTLLYCSLFEQTNNAQYKFFPALLSVRKLNNQNYR